MAATATEVARRAKALFGMAENDYAQGDFAGVPGSRSRASEILSGRRELTLDHIRRLVRAWRIPAAALNDRMVIA